MPCVATQVINKAVDRQRSRHDKLGIVERILRVVLGGALAVWALSLLHSGDLISRFLHFALIVLGADFVYTGIRG